MDFRTVCALVAALMALFFFGRAVPRIIDYNHFTVKRLGNIERVEIKDEGEQLIAHYTYVMQGELFTGSSPMECPIFPNPHAAREWLEARGQQQPLPIWVDPSSPSLSTACRAFPWNLCGRGIAASAVALYFLFYKKIFKY